MKDMHNIPEWIFDRVQTVSFEKLDPAEKEKVIQFFSKEEYEEMHAVIAGVKTEKDPAAARRKQIKEDLLVEFDKTYATSEKRNLLFYPMDMWKSAAAVLVGILATWWLVGRGQVAEGHSLIAGTDTVYVDKPVYAEPIRIRDTVYIEKETASETKAPKVNQRKVRDHYPDEVAADAFVENVVTVDQLESPANRSRNNSMKHDSLLSTFSFVRL